MSHLVSLLPYTTPSTGQITNKDIGLNVLAETALPNLCKIVSHYMMHIDTYIL